MDTYGHLQTSTGIYGHIWAPADIYGHLWALGTFTDTYKYVSVGNKAYQVSMDTYERPQPSLSSENTANVVGQKHSAFYFLLSAYGMHHVYSGCISYDNNKYRVSFVVPS